LVAEKVYNNKKREQGQFAKVKIPSRLFPLRLVPCSQIKIINLRAMLRLFQNFSFWKKLSLQKHFYGR